MYANVMFNVYLIQIRLIHFGFSELFKIIEHLLINLIHSLYGAAGRFVSGVS